METINIGWYPRISHHFCESLHLIQVTLYPLLVGCTLNEFSALGDLEGSNRGKHSVPEKGDLHPGPLTEGFVTQSGRYRVECLKCCPFAILTGLSWGEAVQALSKFLSLSSSGHRKEKTNYC